MSNRQQSIFFLAIVFLFTSGAGLLIYRQYSDYYSQKAEIDLEAALTVQPAVRKLPASPDASALGQISGWKIYKNNKYGFEFQYPKDWNFSDGNTGQPFQLKPDGTWPFNPFVIVGNPLSGIKVYPVYLFIMPNPNGLTPMEFVKNMLAAAPKDGPGSIKYDKAFSLIVGGSRAYELYNTFNYDENDEQIYFASQSLIYRLSFPVADSNPNLSNPKENNAVAHQIVSTFKITP